MGLLWSCYSCQGLKGNGHQQAAWSVTLPVIKPQCVKLIQVHPQEYWVKVLLLEVFSVENVYLRKSFSVECINFLLFQQEIDLSVSFLWGWKLYFDFTVLYLSREVKTSVTKLVPFRFPLNKELEAGLDGLTIMALCPLTAYAHFKRGVLWNMRASFIILLYISDCFLK